MVCGIQATPLEKFPSCTSHSELSKHRNLRVDNIALVHYEHKYRKPDNRMGCVLVLQTDCDQLVTTVDFWMRQRDSQKKSLPYKIKNVYCVTGYQKSGIRWYPNTRQSDVGKTNYVQNNKLNKLGRRPIFVSIRSSRDNKTILNIETTLTQ